MDDNTSMKKIFLITTVSAAALLGACGSASSSSTKPSAPTKVVKVKKTQPLKVTSFGWNKTQTVLTLPYVGRATNTITTFAQQDNSFYKEVINPKYWVKSATFGQYIFVGPYTSGVNYQRVRDAKLGAVIAMEKDVLFVRGATTWPSKIGTINATVYSQPTIGDMPSVVAVEQFDAKHFPGKTYTLDVPSVATIVESPVGELTPEMMANTPSQEQYSVPGTCIPHTFAAYFQGTTTPAMTGPGDFPNAVYEVQYGPTNDLASTNPNANGEGYNPTSSCNTMP